MLRTEERAKEIRERFLGLPGAEHIAHEFSILGLLQLLEVKRPRHVLELGAGIGTLTYTLVTTLEAPFQLDTFEKNDFCFTELRKNVSEYLDRIRVFRSIDDFTAGPNSYDLIVGDGGPYDERVFRALRIGGVMFFEGDRTQLRYMARKALRSLALCREINYRPPSGTKGYWIMQTEPAPKWRCLLDYGLYVFPTWLRYRNQFARKVPGD